MARWSAPVAVLVTWCLLTCCAGIVKVANEREGTDDVLFDSAEVLNINKLPILLEKLREGYARKWLRQYNAKYELLINREALANWQYETNITDENAAKSEEVEKEMIKWTEEQQPEARRYCYHFKRCESGLAPCKPANITYALRRIVNTQSSAAPHNATERDEMLHISTQLQSIFSKAEVEKDGQKLKLEPELTEIMAKSRDYDELLWAWVAWRNVSGRPMRVPYSVFVDLQNKGAADIGLADAGTHWRISHYGMDGDLEDMVDHLYKEVMPLYRQLHAYVRRKLIQLYPNRGINATGPIPAHLLGNMWAQQWNDIYDVLVPFPEVPDIDVTSKMKEKNYTPRKMLELAEDFFVSLGLLPMTKTFWNKSMVERPVGREVVCHAAAEDFFLGDDYRIKMCATVTQDDLMTMHHEMGHIEYFMLYRKQYPIFRDGANAAFHEAVGDTIALSAMTPKHLASIGLLDDKRRSRATSHDHNKAEINFLMKMALEKIAFLPFGYLIDKYRWDVFRGEIPSANYTTKWWEYRLKYQGILPPIKRTEEDFDPGAKYHVAANVPYIRYFLSFIGQFQFHKALCEAAGSVEKLHECDIYNSTKAGQRLKDALSLGSSRPWPDVMQVLTRERSFSASAIKLYFQPLTNWLNAQNAGEKLGWDGEYVSPDPGDPEVREWLSEQSTNEEVDARELLRVLLRAAEE